MPHSGVTTFSTGITAAVAPTGIVHGPDENLWFAEFSTSRISRITPTGTITEFTLPVGSGGFSDPEDITAGPGGALFFTDFGRDQIGRITTGGQITQFNLPTGRGP